MVDKKTFKNLISKGLTGKEVGLLAFHDSWEVDHMRPELLSESDFEKLKAGLVERQDIASYNRMIDAYRAVDYTLKMARIISLEIESSLNLLYRVGHDYLIHNSVKVARLRQPVVFTEKQYLELKAKQREKKLQEEWTLFEAAMMRVMELATDEQKEEASQDPDELVQLYPDIGDEAAIQVLKALPDGFTFEGEKLEEIMDKPGSLSTDDAADLFLEAKLTGEQLYQTGLPEFVERIDNYQPGLYDNDPYGSRDVSILVDPSPEILDENGYYKGEDGLAWMSTMTDNSRIDEELKAKSFKTLVAQAKAKIKVFLAFYELFQALSDVLDFSLMEDLDKYYEDVEDDVELYNSAARPRAPLQYFPPDWKLSSISLSKLKPDKKEKEHLRDRMAMSFGDNWWTSNFQIDIKEALGELVLNNSLYDEDRDDGQEE